MKENRHLDAADDGVWWEIVDMGLTVVIGTLGASVAAWACFEALWWAVRMGWL